jgi:hypothetical protein
VPSETAVKRLIALVLLVCAVGSVWAADQTPPMACAVLSEQEALALVGGPLGEIFRHVETPHAQNGYDYASICGFFPKGYDIQKADRPPERGIEVALHSLRTKADAKAYYDNSLAARQEMAKLPGSPFVNARYTAVGGLGEAAVLESRSLEPEPKVTYSVAAVIFLKGSVMGQVTTWKKGTPDDTIASAAAKQVTAKLP